MQIRGDDSTCEDNYPPAYWQDRASYFERRASTLRAALVALSSLEVKGHALIDRLQFSTEGRALAAQIAEALK